MLVKKLLFVVLCLLALSALPAAAQDTTETAPASTTINISMTDYNFVVDGQKPGDPLVLQIGQSYEIHFTNNSATKVPHEVLMGKDPKMDGKYKHDYKTFLLDGEEVTFSGQMNGQDFDVVATGMSEFELPPGGDLSISFTLTDDKKVGDWEMGCFEFLSTTNSDSNPGPSHYDVGMHLPIKVTPAASS